MNAALPAAVRLARLLILLLLPLAAAAHDGHQHEEAAPVAEAAVVAAGDRVAAATARVELVAVRAADGGLDIHADDYASNAPLAAVALRLRIGDRSIQAEAQSAGHWQLPAALLADVAPATVVAYHFEGAGWQQSLAAPLPDRPQPSVAGETRSGGDSRGLLLVLLPLLALVAVQHRASPVVD